MGLAVRNIFRLPTMVLLLLGHYKLLKSLLHLDVSRKLQPFAWYSFSPSLSPGMVVTISTCNLITNYDTILFVFDGFNCNQISCLTYDDDSSCAVGTSLSSTVTFVPSNYPNQSNYYIAVGAYSGSPSGLI